MPIRRRTEPLARIDAFRLNQIDAFGEPTKETREAFQRYIGRGLIDKKWKLTELGREMLAAYYEENRKVG